MSKLNAPTIDEFVDNKTLVGKKSKGIEETIEMYRSAIIQAAGERRNVDQIIAMSTQIISRNPGLKECTAGSIIGSILQSTLLNLDATPGVDECYFIPRKNNKLQITECQFMIGYRGYITLAMNTGEVRSVESRIVYKNDSFFYEYGLQASLVHRPVIFEDPGEMIGVYCIWKFTGGGYYFEVMSKDEILKVKKMSPASDSKFSPWNVPEHEPAMWKKTVLRRSRKFVPMSSIRSRLMLRAFNADETVVTEKDFDSLRDQFKETAQIQKQGVQPAPGSTIPGEADTHFGNGETESLGSADLFPGPESKLL